MRSPDVDAQFCDLCENPCGDARPDRRVTVPTCVTSDHGPYSTGFWVGRLHFLFASAANKLKSLLGRHFRDNAWLTVRWHALVVPDPSTLTGQTDPMRAACHSGLAFGMMRSR